MRDRLFIVTLFLAIISCSDENLPDGIYDYQVERLLSGQSGSKAWAQEIGSTSCVDSIYLYFELVEDQASDSLDISRITRNADCTSYDTSLIGRANASSIEGLELFTDSLVFASNDFWLVDNITSQILTLETDGQILRFTSK